jgi:hypothetical protein
MYYPSAYDDCPHSRYENDLVLYDLIIGLHTYNKYINLNDIEKTVEERYTIDYDTQFGLTDSTFDYKINKIELTKEDSYWFYIYPPAPITIYNLDTVEKSSSNEIVEVPCEEGEANCMRFYKVSLRYSISTDVKQYKRKVFNILELTGIIGGIFELFEILISLTIGVITSCWFKRELNKDIQKANLQYNIIKTQFEEMRKRLDAREIQINANSNPQQQENEGGSSEEEKSELAQTRKKKH